MLFKIRFPRVGTYLSVTGTAVPTAGVSEVAYSKILETSISWNPSAATISHAFYQGLLQGLGGFQQLLGLLSQSLLHGGFPCFFQLF